MKNNLRNRDVHQPPRHNNHLADGFAFEPGLDFFGGEGSGFDFFFASKPVYILTLLGLTGSVAFLVFF
ncbi:hypothetical protein [Pontiella sulfatireligans]|uniref:hypothetical protein n=1 Tax=Pontiella sulfatireligans TaxID=2750658 RepID=UPI00109D6D26|nr:hypothetical protein [Pontiella sulfatireligans]